MKNLFEERYRATPAALDRESIIEHLLDVVEDDNMHDCVFNKCEAMIKQYKISANPDWDLSDILDRFTTKQLRELLQYVMDNYKNEALREDVESIEIPAPYNQYYDLSPDGVNFDELPDAFDHYGDLKVVAELYAKEQYADALANNSLESCWLVEDEIGKLLLVTAVAERVYPITLEEIQDCVDDGYSDNYFDFSEGFTGEPSSIEYGAAMSRHFRAIADAIKKHNIRKIDYKRSVQYDGVVNGHSFFFVEANTGTGHYAEELYIDDKEVNLYQSKESQRSFATLNEMNQFGILSLVKMLENDNLSGIVYRDANTLDDYEEGLVEDVEMSDVQRLALDELDSCLEYGELTDEQHALGYQIQWDINFEDVLLFINGIDADLKDIKHVEYGDCDETKYDGCYSVTFHNGDVKRYGWHDFDMTGSLTCIDCNERLSGSTHAVLESVESTIEDYMSQSELDVETSLTSNLSIRSGRKAARVDTIYIQFDPGFDETPRLVGYAHFDDGGYDHQDLSAADISNYDLGKYMNGTSVTDLEGMLRDNPSILFESVDLIESDNAENWQEYARSSLGYGGSPEFLDELWEEFKDAAIKLVERAGYSTVELDTTLKSDWFRAWKDGVPYTGRCDLSYEKSIFRNCCLEASTREEALDLCARKYAELILKNLRPDRSWDRRLGESRSKYARRASIRESRSKNSVSDELYNVYNTALDTMLSGANADLPKNIKAAFSALGGSAFFKSVKPHSISGDGYLPQEGNDRGYSINFMISDQRDVTRLAQDITMAYYRTKLNGQLYTTSQLMKLVQNHDTVELTENILGAKNKSEDYDRVDARDFVKHPMNYDVTSNLDFEVPDDVKVYAHRGPGKQSEFYIIIGDTYVKHSFNNLKTVEKYLRRKKLVKEVISESFQPGDLVYVTVANRPGRVKRMIKPDVVEVELDDNGVNPARIDRYYTNEVELLGGDEDLYEDAEMETYTTSLCFADYCKTFRECQDFFGYHADQYGLTITCNQTDDEHCTIKIVGPAEAVRRYKDDFELDEQDAANAERTMRAASLHEDTSTPELDTFMQTSPAMQEFMNTDVDKMTLQIIKAATDEFFRNLNKFPDGMAGLSMDLECDKAAFYKKYLPFANKCKEITKSPAYNATGYGRRDALKISIKEQADRVMYRFPFGWSYNSINQWNIQDFGTALLR